MLAQKSIDFSKAYFKRGEDENPKFWSRFGGKPLFQNMSVLDVGCGLGSLCVDIALSGAQKVVGMDIKPERIDFANMIVKENYPQLTNIVEFTDENLTHYPEGTFDLIVSKDTFEHIRDVEGVLNEMKRCLKPGGRLFLGFGPLYNAPFGDHGWTRTRIPWGHLFFEESKIIDRLNRLIARGERVSNYRQGRLTSIYDLGLSKLSFSDYRKIFQDSGLTIVSLRVNQSTNHVLRLFSLIRKIPFLEEYFTYNIYCVLEKA